MTNKKSTEPLSRSERVRILLKEGRSVQEIAATVGVTAQFVYNVQYSVRKKAKDAEAKPDAVRISPRTGKPVRKYTKRKAKKTLADPKKKVEALIVVPKPEFLRMQEENVTLRREIQTLPKVIEVKVPQPFSHYTFMQRLRILFLGGAA